MKENSLVIELQHFAGFMEGRQKKFYDQMIKDAKPVEVVPLSEVFTPEQIDFIRKAVRPKAICGYPGIGKTYLTNQDSRFVDGWLSEHLYIDKSKGIRNPDFPSNYMRTVSDIVKQGKIVVTAMSEEARDVFNMLDIPFVVIYPNASEKDRYFNIYDTRPDVREWISLNKRV